MLFEFDSTESVRAKADPNRGIGFVEAQELWLDPVCVEVPLPFEAELWVAVIGKIGDRIWTAVVTRRGASIRIISVRRAHPTEERIYAAG